MTADDAATESRDAFNTIAWNDFITFAWDEPKLRAEFTAKTGVVIFRGEDGQVQRAIAARFIEWVTREHWGLEHAPAAYRQALEKAP